MSYSVKGAIGCIIQKQVLRGGLGCKMLFWDQSSWKEVGRGGLGKGRCPTMEQVWQSLGSQLELCSQRSCQRCPAMGPCNAHGVGCPGRYMNFGGSILCSWGRPWMGKLEAVHSLYHPKLDSKSSLEEGIMPFATQIRFGKVEHIISRHPLAWPERAQFTVHASHTLLVSTNVGRPDGDCQSGWPALRPTWGEITMQEFVRECTWDHQLCKEEDWTAGEADLEAASTEARPLGTSVAGQGGQTFILHKNITWPRCPGRRSWPWLRCHFSSEAIQMRLML